MNHWFALLNILGSAVLVAFGLFVWRVQPGNARNQAFCLFALGFSLSTALANVEQLLGLAGSALTVEVTLRGLLYGLGGAGAAWFGFATVHPDRRMAAWAAFPGVLLLAVLAGIHVTGFSESPYGPIAAAVESLGFAGLLGGCVFGVLLFAFDFGRPERGLELRQERAYLAAALILYPAFYLTLITASTFGPASVNPTLTSPLAGTLLSVCTFGTILFVVGAWIRNARIPEVSSMARNVALLAVGMGVVGLAVSLTDTPGSYGVPFLARVGAVAILGYAILRGQILGIEAKVEWGVSKTTLAGIFIAVFFIAGELAETFFGDVFDSDYIGVIAAGALVFAISPLQRFADRFAAKAVPGGAEAGGDAETRYRQALRMALADGEISPGEEDELADRAEALGLGPKRALELRREVEDEMSRRGDQGGRV